MHKFHVRDNKVLTYLLTYLQEASQTPLHMIVSVAICYHCARVAVGPPRHVCSTRRLVLPCPLGWHHISSLDASRESNAGGFRFQVSGLYSLPSFKMIIGCVQWQGHEKKIK